MAPAEIDRLPFDPLRLVTTEGVVAEMVALPAPTPILIIPAPDRFSKFENVPAELEVVFPNAVRETEDVWTEAEMVIVLAACPIPIPAPAEMLTLFVVALRVKVVPPPPGLAPMMVIAGEVDN